MGSVFRKLISRPLPEGARPLTRDGKLLAEWKGSDGRKHTGEIREIEGGLAKVLVRSSTYFAKYRDGSGIVRVVATHCREEAAARSVLAQLERRSELVRAGVMSAAEEAAGQEQGILLADHVTAFVEHLRARRVVGGRVKTMNRRLESVSAALHWIRLEDLSAEQLERHLSARRGEGMGPSVWNGIREAFVAFERWAIDTGRVLQGRLRLVPKLDERLDPRRPRRPLTEEELQRLVQVAQERPLKDAQKINRGARKGEEGAQVKPHVKLRLGLLGLERATLYKALALTGLRRGELASVTLARVDLDAKVPHLVLEAVDEKNRQGSTIPLRADLVTDIRAWLQRKLEALQLEAKRRGQPIPMRLDPSMPLFVVPKALVKILDRDLVAAGIPKRDDRGRTVDVHALRHTFGTNLAKAGVPLRTAQTLMRHSDPRLTANTYQHLELEDVAGAIKALPAIPLESAGSEAKATGTDGVSTVTNPPFPVAPAVAPTPEDSCKLRPLPGHLAVSGLEAPEDKANEENPRFPHKKASLAEVASEADLVGVIGFEPTTSTSRT